MFERTRQDLDMVGKMQQPTVSSVLGLCDDLFRDVLTEQQMDVAELPEEDPSQMAALMIRIMKKMNYLYRKNETLFSEESLEERWNRASEGTEQTLAALERLEQEEKKRSEQEDAWQKKIKEQEAILAQKDQEIQELEKKAQAMEQTILEREALVHEQELKLRLQEERINGKEQEREPLLDRFAKAKALAEKVREELLPLEAQCRQAEEEREIERTKLVQAEEEFKRKAAELLRLKNFWSTIWKAYENDREILPEGGRDQSAEEALNRRYEQILHEIDSFREDYRRLLSLAGERR